MVERVGKISRTKTVENEVGRPFGRREGYAQEGDNGTFGRMLQHQIKEKDKPAEELPEPEAYSLDLQRATQSLFYKKGPQLRHIGKDLYAK